MAAAHSPTREGSTRRALPGLAGLLVLCACTLVGSVAGPAGADVVLTGTASGAASTSDAPPSTPAPTPAPSPAPSVPGAAPVPSGSSPAPSPTGSPVRTIPRPGVLDTRPRPAPEVLEPTRVRVGDVDLEMAVVPVGVDEDGAMALPEDPGVAGWYRFGAAPGASTGTTVLAAHVDSLDRVGPFARLAGVQAGSDVVLDTPDGPVDYVVTGVEQVRRDRLAVSEVFARGGPHRVVLITCGGPYRPGEGYRDNVVLTAEPRGR